METDFYLASRARARLALSLIAPLFLCASAGCAVLHSRNEWKAPALYSPSYLTEQTGDCLATAEAQYVAGQEAATAGNAACIDFFYAAAVQAWPYHVAGFATADDRATDLYRSSVQLFIASAARFGRFHHTHGVMLASGQCVPITYHGFVWQPADFCQFLPVGTYQSERLETRYAWPGVGMPYVVLTTTPAQHPFTNFGQPFAATAVLAPSPSLGGGMALQFYDPLRRSATDTGLAVVRDLTSPIAYAASQESDLWLDNFVRPGRDDARSGLHMHEPFQPGKIPVVLIHGLASEPLTWSQLENEVRAQPALFNRYQFWFFRYDTGDPFLGSAARLRRQLAELRQTYDPARCDPSLSQMVLIGHSMGGLLSKMQVTYSGNEIWNASATQPFETIFTDPATRADLAAAFFFQPSPDVRRVIYIATPHQGSVEATQCVGRLSSALVEERPEWVGRHEQLVRDNPCAFREELQRGVPTSVDLLEPDSLILQASNRLPYANGVALNSIIGDDRWSLGQGPSDGAVAVSSARIGGVQSELVVDAKHTLLLRDQRTVREVICILMQHAAMSGCY